MANNNAFAGLDMNALLNSGIDLSVLNSLSQAQQQQQRPPMNMQGQGPPPQNMGGMQGLNMGMLGNGGMQQQPQNMTGNGMRNVQQPNNGMTNAQLLDAFTRMQANQMASQMQNRGGTPNMGAAPQLNRTASGQFPGGQQQQQQQQPPPPGDQNNQYQQLHRLLAAKNAAGGMQNPMRPPFNHQQSGDMLQGNNAQNGMNPNLTAAQIQLRQAASQNLNRVQQMQQSMQQQLQQNLGQQANQNQNGNQANMGNAAFLNGLFPGQANQQNQFNMTNSLAPGQKPMPSPQMQNASHQQIRPPANMPQSSPLAPGRPLQQAGVPQNLLELNNQFQSLNEQQKQQLMSLYQHQGRAFSNQMTPRTLSQSLQSVNPNSSPIPGGQNANMGMQTGQSQAMASAQQRAHLAQQAQQVAAQFNNNQGQGNAQRPPAPVGLGLTAGQPGVRPIPNAQTGAPPRLPFNWEKISDAELIETGKSMLPKLSAQIKALQRVPPNSPHRAGLENQIRTNNQIRMTFIAEMKRRNLDMSLVGPIPAVGPPQMQQQSQHGTPQTQNQALLGLNSGMPSMPNNVNSMQVDSQSRPGLNVGPGSFANGMPPRATPNPANDSGVAANGLPKATTPQGLAIQQASLVMPRQKFTEIVGSIYRNSRKSEIPNHIIENRPLDLYALFTTVAKFGGCAEVSSKDIWSMVGGLMGFVHNAGPPPISSAEVARQLQQIYSEALHVIEGHYLSVILRQKNQNAPGQGRANQAQAGGAGSKVAGDTTTAATSNNSNQTSFRPPGSTNGALPSDMGGFTLDQLNKLAMASSAQLAGHNLTPEQMSIIHRHRTTLISAYQQKTGGMRPPGMAMPSSGPNAKGEWNIKGHVITPQDYEKGKQIVSRMYNTHIASIQLNPEPIPEEERPNYQKQITSAMQMLRNFDHVMTLEFAMRPEKHNETDVINLYKVAGLLRRAAAKWVQEHVAMLRSQVLGSALQKVAFETTKIRRTHLADSVPPTNRATSATPAAQSVEKAQAIPSGTNSGGESNGVIPPRLRVEDLKPPPNKRQKQSKDERSSPAGTTARGVSVGTDGNPPTPTLPQNANVPSPTTKKLPRPKPTRRKPSVAAASKPDVITKVEKPPVPANASPADPPEISLTLPQFTGLADVTAQDNSLGISFRQMGVAAVAAHRKEEEDGRMDPLSFLEASMSKLESVMRNSGQAFTGLERDLSLSFAPIVQDIRCDPSRQTQPQLQRRPNEQESTFDYSSFIDESAFGFSNDTEESPNKPGEMQAPAETPDLLANPLGLVDPSPSSVVAITPHGVQLNTAEYDNVYSPKPANVEYPFGEDGWLDNLGMDLSYWTS